MDELEDSEDLAEIESLLYSQIHHSIDLEPNDKEMASDTSSTKQNTPHRYYVREPSIQNFTENINHLKQQQMHDKNQNQDFQLYPNFSAPLPQTIHLSSNQPIQFPVTQIFPPAVNNIVFMTSNGSTNNSGLTKNQKRELNKQLRREKKQLYNLAHTDAEVFRRLNKQERVIVLKSQKRQRYMLRKKERKKLLKEQKLIDKYNRECAESLANQDTEPKTDDCQKKELIKTKLEPSKIVSAPNEVIELSESDEDAIVVIEQKYETVVLTSDDDEEMEQLTKASEQVQCNEDISQILDIPVTDEKLMDDVVEQADKTDAELMKPPSDAETTSISSVTSRLSSEKNPRTPKAQRIAVSRDLTNTPESSNDFLDNTLDMSEKDGFHFGFQDHDLEGQTGFLKPRSLAEIYETESSCSASDAGSLRNPVFNELEFDSPSKQLFGDANLESFGDFITPKRKSVSIPSILTADSIGEQLLEHVSDKPTTSHRSEKSDSDTSSESEYEDEPKSAQKKGRKKLPTLSHFDIEDVQARSTPQSKKSKGKNSSKNKFDFIKDADVEESEMSQTVDDDAEIVVIRSTNKKSKKRKQNTECNQDSHDNYNQEGSVFEASKGGKLTSKKRKKQNSKSDTELDKKSHDREPKGSFSAKSDSELEENQTKKSEKKVHKSTSESEQNTEAELSNENDIISKPLDANSIGITSEMSKRRKRKSKHDSPVEGTELSTGINNIDKKRRANSTECAIIDEVILSPCIKEIGKKDTVHDEDIDFLSSSDDVQIIDDSTPDCIDLDDSHFKSSDDEEQFNFDELENLSTNIHLSNVKNESLQNSWEVQSELNTSIKYEPTASTSTAEDIPMKIDCDPEEKSWLKHQFDSDRVLRTLPSDPTKWKILERDRVHIKLPNGPPRCKKCREIGHSAYKCKRELRCWLCGDVGHQEPRCPNTICTRCGRKTQFFTTRCGRCVDLVHYICKTCGSKGHSEDLCPDFWRRYHLTTEVGPVKQAPVNLKPSTERWCSGCAQQGHFEHNCTYYNRTHIPTKPHILRYNDVYKMTSRKSEPMRSPNKDPCEENIAPAVQHKNIEVKLKINKQVDQILQSAKGMKLLKELENNLYFTHSFEKEADSYYLKVEAHPTDVLKIKNLLSDFINNPTISYRKMILTNSQLNTFDSDKGHSLIASLNTLNVSHKMETKLPVKAIYLHGDALDIILAQHKIDMFIAKAVEQIITIKTIDSKKGQKRIQAVLKVKPYIIQELQAHPALETYMNNLMIKWSVTDAQMILEGPSQNVRNAANNLVGKGIKCPTYNMFVRITKLIEHANSLNQTVDNLNTLLHDRKYDTLNLLISIMENKNNKLVELAHLREVFESNPVCIKEYAKQFKNILQSLEQPRKHKYYINAIKKLANNCNNKPNTTETSSGSSGNECPMNINAVKQNDGENVLNLYNFGDPCEDGYSVFYVSIQPHHAVHLMRTDEGNDFLAELNTQISLEVKLEQPSLCLYCNDMQKEEIMKKVNFYFQILEFQFPKKPSVIYRNLTTRLSRVALEYYLTSCKDLYDEIFRTKNNDPTMFAKLHSLLFAKYDFLDGRKHVNTIKYYLGIVSKMSDKESLSWTDFRKIKTAAMFVFCPFPMDIDYKLMISLATPPAVPKFVTNTNYNDSVNNIRSRLKQLKHALSPRKDDIEICEIKTIQSYVYKKNFSEDAIHVASAFLNEKHNV